MNSKIEYSDEPIAAAVVEDFLPPPEQLDFQDSDICITISLSQASLDFLRREERRSGLSCAGQIRQLIERHMLDANASMKN